MTDGSCNYLHNINSLLPVKFDWTAQTPISRNLFQAVTAISSFLTLSVQAWTKHPKTQKWTNLGETQDSFLTILERDLPSSQMGIRKQVVCLTSVA